MLHYTNGIYSKPRKTASVHACRWLYFFVWSRVTGTLKSAHAQYISILIAIINIITVVHNIHNAQQ